MDLDVLQEEGTSHHTTDCQQAAVSFRDASSTIKRKRLERPKTPINVDVSSLKTTDGTPNDQNRFRILGLLDIETNECSSNNNSGQSNKKQDTSGRPVRKAFCPPIFLYNVNITRLVQQLEAKSPKIDFKIKNVNSFKSKLYLSDAAVHTEMMQLLREKEIKSYSFTPKEHKQVSLILRGLYHGSVVEDVKAALDVIVPDTVSKVTKFTTAHSIRIKHDTGLFLVSLLPGKSLTDVGNIKYLLSQTVIWEKPIKKEQAIQCHRCQRWGHISRNCNSMYNCVKCDKKHLPGECLHVRTDESYPYCVNCENEGHPANWRGCPSYKDYVAKRKQRINKVIGERTTATKNVNRAVSATLFSPGKSFASLFKPQQEQQHNTLPKPSIVDEFMKLACFFMQPEELTLEQEINKFMFEYKTMPTLDAKSEFLRLFHKVKTNYGP